MLTLLRHVPKSGQEAESQTRPEAVARASPCGAGSWLMSRGQRALSTRLGRMRSGPSTVSPQTPACERAQNHGRGRVGESQQRTRFVSLFTQNLTYVIENFYNLIFNNGWVKQQTCPDPKTLKTFAAAFAKVELRRQKGGRRRGSEKMRNAGGHNPSRMEGPANVGRGNGLKRFFLTSELAFAEKDHGTQPDRPSRHKPWRKTSLPLFSTHGFYGCKDRDQKGCPLVIGHLCRRQSKRLPFRSPALPSLSAPRRESVTRLGCVPTGRGWGTGTSAPLAGQARVRSQCPETRLSGPALPWRPVQRCGQLLGRGRHRPSSPGAPAICSLLPAFSQTLQGLWCMLTGFCVLFFF